MKTRAQLSAIVIAVFLGLLSGCSSSPMKMNNASDLPSQGKGDTTWVYENQFPQPLTGVLDNEGELRLGSLSTNKVELTVAPGATISGFTLKLQNPTKVPKVFGQQMETIGAPIEVVAGEKPLRLDNKATIRFAFDPKKLDSGTVPSELRVVYFDGQERSTIRPSFIDMTGGIVQFETCHFSLFGLNKIKDKTKITEERIHSKTLDDELKKNLNSMSDHVTNQIIDLTLQKMGINDKSLKAKILADVLKDDGYKKIYDAYEKGDVLGLNQKISLLAGKKIAQIVPDSVFKSALKGTLDLKDDIEAVSKAAGFAAEGRYEDAARIIGEDIADKFLITTAGKIAGEVMQGQIDSWKNKEVEAAYMAYKNGADGYFWGYNVDPGDFNSVRDQMRGIRRQLEIDAIAKENTIRRESGMEPLSTSQEDMVREGVKASFQKQFALRKEREVEITKEEEKLRLVIDGFAAANFFDSTLGPVGLDRGLDFESKLDVLGYFASKMMKDTGRFSVSSKEGLLVEGALQISDIVQAGRLYFSGPEGKKAYNKFLKDRFGIIIAPSLEELAGNRNGTATITSIVLSEEAKSQVAKGEKPEGCDFDINLEELIGKSNPISMTITPQGKDSGSLIVKSSGGEAGKSDNQQTSFTYVDGILTASMSQEGVVGEVNITMSSEGKSFQGVGSLIAKYGTVATITIQIHISK